MSKPEETAAAYPPPMTPTGLTAEQVGEGLRTIVTELAVSSDHGERMLGLLFDTALRFAPEEQTADVLRQFCQELENALNHFERQWMKLCGE